MKIQLIRKLGQNAAGTTIDRSAPEAEQLIRQGFAVHASQDVSSAAQQGEEEDSLWLERASPQLLRAGHALLQQRPVQ
jgi:hypothetical protein